MKFTVVITTFQEADTIGRAIRQIVKPNRELWNNMQIVVAGGDDETLRAGKEELLSYRGFTNYLLIRDEAKGKPAAMNLAVTKAIGDVLIFTDGDMWVDDGAVKALMSAFALGGNEVGGVCGRRVSADNRNPLFGYYSHLFCEAADRKRLSDPLIPMSGYLYAVKNIKSLFPIPEHIRAEDAYISKKLQDFGYQTIYEPKAVAYVHFPKNLKDWFKQKTRSLGGNVQLGIIPANNYPNESKINSSNVKQSKSTENPSIFHHRSIFQDFKMALFPIRFAKSPKEFLYSMFLYPLRFYLWLLIYKQHATRSYSNGRWQRIESSKG